MPIGPAVRAARVAAGQDLDALAAATRIRRTVLERIEADDFSLCGGDVYARGHLRAIGHALGADPEPWVATFDADHDVSAPSATAVLEHDDVMAPRRGTNWTVAMALALVAVLGFGGWAAVTDGGSPAGSDAAGPAVVAGEAPAPSGPRPTDPPVETESERPPSTPDPDAVAAADDQVTIDLRATDDRSWVSVSRSPSEVLFQGILEPGQERSFSDDSSLSLIVGNGGAVALTVNGRDLGAPGGSGEVVRLTFGPGDPSAG